MASNWSPDSWRKHEARQQPHYRDGAALDAATAELASYPALVDATEARALKVALAEAQAGRAFLLQGGDCAESFAEFSLPNIDANFHLIERMAETLAAASGLPVIRIGRIAGQFAKPRSSATETKSAITLPAYRGDIVNGIAFDAAERAPDPARMFRAYAQAYATLARLRELSAVSNNRLFTSHEALLLPWEEAFARKDASGRTYATSAHFLWIGDRTRFAGSAHVEFARGLSNPLGVKCGPELEPDALLALLDLLNPAREPGRITLISRMGADRIGHALPRLIRAASREGHPVLWTCDPMHGNTVTAANGYKTRPIDAILAETAHFFDVARAEGMHGGGVHIEMTGQNVTECTGGLVEITEQDLGDRYHSYCDPRLNPDQAMELAGLVAGRMPRRASAAA